MDLFEENNITFFGLLNKHQVRYILVGWFAVNHLITEKEKSERPKDKIDAEQLKKLYR